MKNSYSDTSFFLSVILLIGLIFGSGACVRKSGDNDAEGKKPIFKPMVKDAIEKEVEEIIYPIPSTFEITNMLNEIGVSYILGISNSVKNVDKYFTEKTKALNLGIYGADLSYASTYHMKQDVMLYLEASKKLTDDLEISSAFNETFVEEIEKNMDNKEELVRIISDSFTDTYEYLNNNGKASLSLLIVGGSWVEALFLTTHISANVYNNYEIVKILFEQKNSLNKLITILKDFEEEQHIKEFLDDLAPLKEIYDTMEDSLTEAQVIAISATIETIREKIIS